MSDVERAGAAVVADIKDQELAELRYRIARVNRAIQAGYESAAPSRPAGQPGSYVRGYQNGALDELRRVHTALRDGVPPGSARRSEGARDGD